MYSGIFMYRRHFLREKYMSLNPLRSKSNTDYQDGACCWFGWMTASKYGIVFTSDGFLLLQKWRAISGSYDGQLSGVLADWIRDNREVLIEQGNDPQDVDDVIDGLMDRFNSESHIDASEQQ